MTDILDKEIGTSELTTGIVKDIQKIAILRPDGNYRDKIVLTVKDPKTGNEYKVSDAYVYDKNNNITIKALWYLEYFDGIHPKSTLAQAMHFYNAKKLKDFRFKEVTLKPDKRNFLTLYCIAEENNDS